MDEQKQAAFLKKAEANKQNFELHSSLIGTHVTPKGELEKSSIQHFLENGKPTGGFLLKLMAYAEAYHKEKSKFPAEVKNEFIPGSYFIANKTGEDTWEQLTEESKSYSDTLHTLNATTKKYFPNAIIVGRAEKI